MRKEISLTFFFSCTCIPNYHKLSNVEDSFSHLTLSLGAQLTIAQLKCN